MRYYLCMSTTISQIDPKTNARDIAYFVLNKVELQDAYANLVLDNALRKQNISPEDTRLITEIVYGVIRQKRYLDWILRQFLLKKKRALPAHLENIFRIGIYQLFFLDSIPDYAAVNETILLAERHGFTTHKSFINAVLRNILRKKSTILLPDKRNDPLTHIAIKYSHPDWMVKLFLNQFDLENTIHLCESNNLPAPTHLKINTLKITLSEFTKLLHQQDIQTHPSPLLPDSLILDSHCPIRQLPGFKEGYFHVQDDASQLVCHVVHPEPCAIVLDLCAAPGGKAFYMAQVMKNKGEIIAIDLNEKRLRLLEETSEKMGISIIKSRAVDATGDLSPIIQGLADIILVDAPCSGLGVLRRKVDARWKKKEQDISNLVNLQRNLLQNAVQYLRPDGILVYSTCTLTKEENQLQIQSFLLEHPEMKLESVESYLPPLAKDTVTEEGYMFTLPFRDRTDGMFACRMRKKS